MTLDIRFGQAEDTHAIADYIITAGNGLFEHLFDGLLPGMSAREVVRMAVADGNSSLNFSNAILVEENGRLLGCCLTYPAEDYGLPPVIRTMLPNKRLAPLKALFESRLEKTLYVNTVVVNEDARGRGVARLLMETAFGLAEEMDADGLSLHAWTDNLSAITLYQSFGFDIVEEITIGESRHLPKGGSMALMHAVASQDGGPAPIPGA